MFVVTKMKIKREELKFLIEFNNTGIKEALNQPYKEESKSEKNKAILNINFLIENSVYKGSAPNIKKNAMVDCYHYFEIELNNEPAYIVIRQMKTNICVFYSIVDKIKENVKTD